MSIILKIEMWNMMVALFPGSTMEWRLTEEEILQMKELCADHQLNYGRVLAIIGKCNIID